MYLAQPRFTVVAISLDQSTNTAYFTQLRPTLLNKMIHFLFSICFNSSLQKTKNIELEILLWFFFIFSSFKLEDYELIRVHSQLILNTIIQPLMNLH